MAGVESFCPWAGKKAIRPDASKLSTRDGQAAGRQAAARTAGLEDILAVRCLVLWAAVGEWALERVFSGPTHRNNRKVTTLSWHRVLHYGRLSRPTAPLIGCSCSQFGPLRRSTLPNAGFAYTEHTQYAMSRATNETPATCMCVT